MLSLFVALQVPASSSSALKSTANAPKISAIISSKSGSTYNLRVNVQHGGRVGNSSVTSTRVSTSFKSCIVPRDRSSCLLRGAQKGRTLKFSVVTRFKSATSSEGKKVSYRVGDKDWKASTPSTTTTTPPSTTTTSTTTTLPRAVIPSLTVNAFDNSSYALSAAQKLQLNKLGARLQAGDSVSCVAYQESNALNLLSRLTVKRSQSVCTYLSTRVRGLLVTPSAQFVPSAQVQISTAKPMQVRSSSTLLRKVVVTTKPRP